MGLLEVVSVFFGLVVMVLSTFWLIPVKYFNLMQRFIVWRSAFKFKSVKLKNGFTCSYIEKGDVKSTKETVVMLHGYSASSIGMIPLGKRFDDSYHVIAIEYLNHGFSSNITHRNVSLEDVLEFLDMFFEKFGELGKRKIHFMGHSTGGYIALHYAKLHPNKMATLTLLSPLGVKIHGEIADPTPAQLDEQLCPLNNEVLLNFIKRVYSGKNPKIPSLILTAARYKRIEKSLAYKRIYNGLVRIAKFTREDMDAVSEIPSLVAWGNDDRILPTTIGLDFFKDNSPTTKRILMENSAGHMFLEVNSRAFFPQLLNWLEANKN